MGWITLVWSAVAVLSGVLVGAFWADLRKSQRSEALSRACDRIRALDTKSDHFAFGITDLDVRIRAANNEIAMLRSDIKVRRATYDRLNSQLRSCWDEAIECKRELAEQEQSAAELKVEIEKWKQKLDTLYKRLEAGQISDRALKRELAAGLSAIFNEAGDELPAVQRLLLEHTIEIGMSGDPAHKGYQEIVELLSARIEMLESQVRYWQDRSTGELSAVQPPPADPAEVAERQGELPFAGSATQAAPAVNNAENPAPPAAQAPKKTTKKPAKASAPGKGRSRSKASSRKSSGSTLA